MKLSDIFPSTQTTKRTPSQRPKTLPKNETGEVKFPGSPYPLIMPKIKTYEKNYFVIKNIPQLESFLNKCVAKGICSFDFETAPNRELLKDFEDRILPELKEKKDEALKDLAAEKAFLVAEFEADFQQITGKTEASISKKQEARKKKLQKAIEKAEKNSIKVFKELDKIHTQEFGKISKFPLNPHKSQICTVSLCHTPGEVGVLFLRHVKGENFPDVEKALELLKNYVFENPYIMKIAYNASFETKFILNEGSQFVEPISDPFIANVRCTQIAMPNKIKDPKNPAGGKGLKPTTLEYFGHKMDDFKQTLEKAGVNFFDEIPAGSPEAVSYAAEDSDYSLRLHYLFMEIAKQIPIENKGYERPFKNYWEWLLNVEMPFSRIIGVMEYNGLRVDEKLTQARKLEAEKKIIEAQNKIVEIGKQFDLEINPGKNGKTKGIREFIFNTLELPEAEISDTTGNASLDSSSVLQIKFMLENNLNHKEEIEAFLTYESFQKEVAKREPHKYRKEGLELLSALSELQLYDTLYSTHIEGRLKYLNDVTGRIHANYSPWTETGRLNSRNPNQQNTPRPANDDFKTRNFIIADPGKLLYLIDFSGFELRLMAWKSNDKVMIDAFRNNADLHKLTACRMTGKQPKDITKEERSSAKAGNFGINYAGTEYALQKTFLGMGIFKTLDQCAEIVNAVKETYPGIAEYQKNIVYEAREQGFIDTIYGYKRILRDINSGYRPFRNSDERRAGNTPIQGSAADIMKLAQNKTYEMIFQKGWSDRIQILAQIHDEQILSVPAEKELLLELDFEIKKIMEAPPIPGFPVPILAESSLAVVWGEKVDFDDFIKTL